jgi:hypothetical protein
VAPESVAGARWRPNTPSASDQPASRRVLRDIRFRSQSGTHAPPSNHLPFERDAAHLFFQLVSRRYERGSMLITSNRSIGKCETVFGDAVVATAILDY